MASLSFDPLISLTLWLTLALAGAALLAWYGAGRPPGLPKRRWRGILALTGAGLALVLGVLLNPTWVESVPPPEGKPLVTLLLDASASMATPDEAGGRTRFQAAAELARGLAGDLDGSCEVRVRLVGESVTAVELAELDRHAPAGRVTDLAAALAGGADDTRPAGQCVVLLSDGIHNAGGGAARVLEAARLARALACPVFTRPFGGDHAVKDLAVEPRAPQEVAFVEQPVAIPVLVRHRGLAGGRTMVTLSLDGKEVDRKPVALPPAGDAEVRFQVRQPKTGLFQYELRAESLPGEVSLANNSAGLQLRVVDRPIRVLLLEGKPYWDGKFLMRTLIADASVELDSLVRMSASRVYRRSLTRATSVEAAKAGAPKAEAREEWKVLVGPADTAAAAELRSYQVVVLGRDAEVFLTDPTLKLLRAWVLDDGGCLVCYRGQPTAQVSHQLAQVLPVRWAPSGESRFRPALTERGKDLHWFPSAGPSPQRDAFAELPSLATSARVEQARPLAVVLATAGAPAEAANPVVTYQSYGLGKVVTIEGSGMWRWAFLPPQQQAHDDVYRALWHSLTRWLVSNAALLPGQSLALRGDKVSFGADEPATATLLVRDGAAAEARSVRLVGTGLDEPRVVSAARAGDETGALRVVFGKLPEGRYQASVVGSDDPAGQTAFDVRSRSDEQLDLKARPDLLARVAAESGGAVLGGETPGPALARIRAHLDGGRPARVLRQPAWDRWWVLLGVLAVWGTAWGLRRSGGLV